MNEGLVIDAILIDSRANAKGLQAFLASNSGVMAHIRVLERRDALKDPGFCASIRHLFSAWNMPQFSDDELATTFPNLEAVFYAGGDTSYFAAPFERRSIQIFTAQAENAIPVAEFVLAQVLLANKGYFLAEQKYERGFWKSAFRKARSLSRSTAGNYKSAVGIIGFGAIGSRVVDMLQSFDFDVLVHDPFVPVEAIEQVSARPADLQEIFRTCDVISNNLPDIEQTRGILDYTLFSSMKSHATFINTGRGLQVDESGLVRAMREAPSRSAMLDVTRREPPWPLSAILRTDNIFISPHIAGSQGGEIVRLYEAIFRQYLTFTGRLGDSKTGLGGLGK